MDEAPIHYYLQGLEDELQEPQPGQVRVRILASGVANTDAMVREGGRVPNLLGAPPPPYCTGKELVGVVDKLGNGVTPSRPARRSPPA